MIWKQIDYFLHIYQEFKLKHGYHREEGILQARCDNNQQWQPVCGDDWLGYTHARHLACRHLGYPESMLGSAYVVPRFVIDRTTPVFLPQPSLFCSGWEENLTDCVFLWSERECIRYAGLLCTNKSK